MADKNNTPTLNTPRLRLRPFTPADATPLHSILNQPNIMQFFPTNTPPDMDRTQAIIERQLAQWADYGLGWWAVTRSGQSELIGWNGLQYLPDTDEVEIGYLLSQRFWGQGLATEGARASLQFGFETLGLQQIIGLTHPDSIASQNVLKKCGMRYIEQREYFGIQVFRFILANSKTT